MTTKFLAMNKLSIRPQNDTEKLMLGNLGTMVQTGKEAVITFDNDEEKSDLVLEIKSKK